VKGAESQLFGATHGLAALMNMPSKSVLSLNQWQTSLFGTRQEDTVEVFPGFAGGFYL